MWTREGMCACLGPFLLGLFLSPHPGTSCCGDQIGTGAKQPLVRVPRSWYSRGLATCWFPVSLSSCVQGRHLNSWQDLD